MSNRKSFYLYTTKKRNHTIPLDSTPLFLGNWCVNIFSDRNDFKNEPVIIKHRWKDKERHNADYEYIEKLYERYLLIVSTRLNDLNGVNNSIQYWRILIGPWLMYMTIVFFERYHCLEDAIKKFDIVGCLKSNESIDRFIPNDMEDFNKFIGQDSWNFFVYSQIIDFLIPNNDFEKLEYVKSKINKDKTGQTLKLFLLKILEFLFSFAAKSFLRSTITESKYLFLGTYLGFRDFIKLNFKTLQVPLYDNISKPQSSKIDFKLRLSLKIKKNKKKNFENYFSEKLFLFLPVIYLEGFVKLKCEYRNLVLPKNPSVIFTSATIYHRSLFMLYVAEKTNQGAKLILGQHGGLYITGKYHRQEKHEIKISDKFLTWGNHNTNHKIVNVGMISKPKFYKRVSHPQKILIVLNSIPQYVGNLNTDNLIVRFDEYIEECLNLCQLLFYNTKLKKNLTLGMYYHDYGWNEKQIFKTKLPDIKYEDTNFNIWKSIAKSKIVIFTYNSTGILELMALNSPILNFIILI